MALTPASPGAEQYCEEVDHANQRLESRSQPIYYYIRRQNACLLTTKTNVIYTNYFTGPPTPASILHMVFIRKVGIYSLSEVRFYHALLRIRSCS